MHTDGTTPPVGAVETTLEILDALRDLNGAGVTELASHLDLPKSTVHNHLKTLERNEYVVNEEGRYRTGLRFLQLGEYTRHQRPLYDAAREKVTELAERTNEIANLAVEEHGRCIYLLREEGPNAVPLDTHAGKHVYMHSTALGKAILAHYPRERVESIVDTHGLPAVTPATVTEPDELFDRLDRVESQGVAFDDQERLNGLRCVAAPIETNDGSAGAVSVSGPTSRIKGDLFREELPETVSEIADVIAINLMYK